MKLIEGDIFEGEWDGLVHCVNLYHIMGGGIAKLIKNKSLLAFVESNFTKVEFHIYSFK